jgi:hypothetical protein
LRLDSFCIILNRFLEGFAGVGCAGVLEGVLDGDEVGGEGAPPELGKELTTTFDGATKELEGELVLKSPEVVPPEATAVETREGVVCAEREAWPFSVVLAEFKGREGVWSVGWAGGGMMPLGA